MPTGGEALVAALEQLGVEVVFGLPGVHNLAAWRAFAGSGVRLVGVRHEQTAAYAADGWARATGRLGVALTTTGPGAANAVTATGEAWSCHSPVLVIATDIPTAQRVPGQYRGVLHECTDQASFFRPVTKEVVHVERAEDLFAEVLRAGRLAMAAPRRPVYLEVPTDLLRAEVDGWFEAPVPVGPSSTVLVDDAVGALLEARRPLVWAGGGATAAKAGGLVRLVAERIGAPVLTSFGGRGLLAPSAPCLVPLPPHAPEAGALWDAADCVLVVGSDLDAMNTQGFRQPRPPTLVTVDVAEPVTYPPDVWVAADAAAALLAVLDALPARRRSPWWHRPEGRSTYAGQETEFLEALESGLPSNAVVVADMCVAGYWYGAFGRVGGARGLAYPVGWGTLGFGFPAALGAALSRRPTVALVGDGGFLFACGELATAAQERLPVTVVLVDDGGYGMLRYDFTKDGEQPLGCDLATPDFVALATAFGVPAREVTVGGLGAAVADGIASGGPSLLVLRAAFGPPLSTSPRWYRAAGRG
ncbi:thiamine pyrophosphate-binding protein [Geodermatophilus sp. YIM 151500]|uniref:thiamine pyrophosphate-binding protein n=1 Tax=Geodermatophilus sp. YIM 151500 TaxID=2984531 RepID=UPI0021E4A120|nr:thiamine pyrophosphate-binding protein [Geodermatophilus sp. YIM 151500]MCV2490633.1 thiamine pyrophosphate-binding protein [Geodermatophilus sp. YIM 151500]